MISLFGRLYRKLFCHSGYGVHSPFAFDLITTVIEEKGAYYCYETLDNIRLQLQTESKKVRCGDKELTVKKAMQMNCFSVKGYKLLFRLANRFRPENVLVIGSGLGLTPLYVSAYSQKTACIVLEKEPSIAVIARNIVKKYTHSSIRIYDKNFGEFDLPESEYFDFIIWGKGTDFSFHSFENVVQYVTDKSVMVIYGINDSFTHKQLWSAMCTSPQVSVTFDFYSFGVVFFNSKLHQKTYKCIPM